MAERFRFAGRPRLMPGEISRRELEVLTVVAYGATYTQAGAALYISPRTVQDHLRNIYARLEVTHREEAVRWAVAHGLIDPSAGVDDDGGFLPELGGT